MDSLFFDQQQWMPQALCSRHPQKELWFSDLKEDVVAAKEICEACCVKTECLEYALDNQIEEGVWGGLDERERSGFLRYRREIH